MNPCPFCGSEAYLVEYSDPVGVDWYMVTCKASVTPEMAVDCRAWPETAWHLDKEIAIIDWDSMKFVNEEDPWSCQ